LLFGHVFSICCRFAFRIMLRTLTISLLVFQVLSGVVEQALCDTFGSGANAFDIEFVTISNPRNAADTTGNPNPAGSVSYRYRIGKFEISERMFAKASAEGGLGIGAVRSDRPATGMSWNEAARFVNWLNTSTGSPPAYKFATQPGEVGYIPNVNIEVWAIGDPGYDLGNLYRNTLARYFLPSVDEWYKAAYYDPASSVYYDYPTGSDSAPTPVASGTAAGTAVYGFQPGPASIMLAGGLSPNGTMGQGGNVWEWNETDSDGENGPDPSLSLRVVRGGRWNQDSSRMSSSISTSMDPTTKSGFPGIGFRIASVIPEPSTFLLGAMASLGLLLRRRALR
jgi:hypothetical protein